MALKQVTFARERRGPRARVIVETRIKTMASYVLSFEERPEYLFARVTARFDSLALALSYWAGIAHECRRLGRDQVLVARQVRVSASRSDTFQIAAALRDLGFFMRPPLDRFQAGNTPPHHVPWIVGAFL